MWPLLWCFCICMIVLQKLAEREKIQMRHMKNGSIQWIQLDEFESSNNKYPMYRWVMMYMRRVMSLIQFVRGTRQRNWNLHLATFEGLCIWFFAYNRLDYVQNIPSHIARMYYFKTTNRQVWNDMEKGGLAIKKTHPQLSVLNRHRISGMKKQYWSFFWDTAWVFQIQESEKMLDMT